MLLRLIVLAALVVVGWVVYKRYLRPADAPPREVGYQRMVACQRCGVHLPADQALTRGDASYCCRDHLPE